MVAKHFSNSTVPNIIAVMFSCEWIIAARIVTQFPIFMTRAKRDGTYVIGFAQ